MGGCKLTQCGRAAPGDLRHGSRIEVAGLRGKNGDYRCGAKRLGILHRLGGAAGQAYAWAGQVWWCMIFKIDVTADYLTAKEEPYLLK